MGVKKIHISIFFRELDKICFLDQLQKSIQVASGYTVSKDDTLVCM